ncbi:MAG TPA: prephenate dehydrogenase/arogenate dehydrogenase family protein [Planctomycetales bacterium]|jgi:prephenate dehydrogenase|nr:prephenate dehydrogenase/arogenate dehydrogenase family protein [Planctomycetales bacterium]
MRIDTLALVGVGLIGGSVGLAARKRGVAGRILGVDSRPEVLQRALTRGVVDQSRPNVGSAAAEADAIVFCTPVDVIAGQVIEATSVCRPGALLTDAGSTKASIVRDVEGRLPQGAGFVGGHPLAGSEKQGPEHANAELFEGRVVVLTPTSRTDDKALSQATALWEALGARVRLMDPEEHDRAMAMTSHLPHVTAAALAGVLPPEWSGLTAGGFRDATRVASGGPELWAAILQANADGVLDAMDQLDKRMAEFRRSLASGDRDALIALLQQGKLLRDGLTC